MRLSGYIDIEVETESIIEQFRVAGQEFSWEEGGENSTSFLFVYFDADERFEIHARFTIENQQIINWDSSVTAQNVTILDDALDVEAKFLNYDPNEDF